MLLFASTDAGGLDHPSTQAEYFREELGSSPDDKRSLSGYKEHKIQIYTDGSGGRILQTRGFVDVAGLG